MLPYFNWQNPALSPATPPAPAVLGKNSPNIEQILAFLKANWGGANLGIYALRAVSGGTAWSSHAFRAANDWGYGSNEARLAAINFLVTNHEVLKVQMVIDEGFNRIWKSYRVELEGPGWKYITIRGGSWLHYETTLDGWPLATPVATRLAPPPIPAPVPVPQPTPIPLPMEEDMPRLIQPFDDSAVMLLDGLTCTWVADGNVAASLFEAGIVPDAVTVVKRNALKAFELVGSPPQYPAGRIYRPGRTVLADFASHRD